MKPQTRWLNPFLWECQRHIPTPIFHGMMETHCRLCRTPQPPRPEVQPLPVAVPEPLPDNVVLMGKVTTRPKCAWPPCRRRARDSSPYCGKNCSDRCGRVRRKPAGQDVDTAQKIQASMETWRTWGKRTG